MSKTSKKNTLLNKVRRPIVSALLVGTALVPFSARASRDLALSYDARSVGMGGTGVAFASPSVGTVFNPALISQTKRVSATVTYSPIIQRLQAPLKNAQGSASEEFYSNTGFGPLGQVGVTARVHERLTLGAIIQIPEATSGRYSSVPSVYILAPSEINAQTAPLTVSLEARLFVTTVSLPLAVEVADWLTVAGAYRMSFFESREILTLAGQPLFKAELSGQNYAGADVGLLIKPHPMVQLGLTYQTQIKSDLKTKVTAGGVRAPTAIQHDAYVDPHRMRAGFAIHPIGPRLLAAGDFSWSLDHTSDRTLRDSFNGNLGLELMATPKVPIRLGGSVGRTSTQPKSGSIATLPSGAVWTVTTGAGYKLSHFDLDAAFGYERIGGQNSAATPMGAYIAQGYQISVSATYHI